MGYCYANGAGTKKDELIAFKYYKLSADQNNTDAQNSLGLCYKHGIGTKKNEQQAYNYFKLAADKNHANGRYNLAQCYENGLGTKKNSIEAAKYRDHNSVPPSRNSLRMLKEFFFN